MCKEVQVTDQATITLVENKNGRWWRVDYDGRQFVAGRVQDLPIISNHRAVKALDVVNASVAPAA